MVHVDALYQSMMIMYHVPLKVLGGISKSWCIGDE